MQQLIHSRYEYPVNGKTSDEIFDEYDEQFNKTFDDRGIQITGVFVAIGGQRNTVILMTLSADVDTFLHLKFYGRKDVKYSKLI